MIERKNSPIPMLAPEGLPFVTIGICLIVAVLIIPAWLGILIFLFYTAFAVWFFRDPERHTPEGRELVISPADGRVVEIEMIDNAPYVGGKARKVGIFMSGFSVHVNRNPISGTVKSVHYKQGGFIKADLPEASLLNEHNAVVIERGDGQRVAFIQISGLVARRIVCYLEPGDAVNTGGRMGMIRFGSRVDVYLPTSGEIKISRGDAVRAGETVIASLPWQPR